MRMATDALYWSGASRVIDVRYGGLGTVFSFHSVVPDLSRHLYPTYRSTVGFLDRWLAALRAKGIDIVDLDEAVRRLGTSGARRFVVLTFDDGYADNLVHALPVLERHAAPFTVYVTDEMISRRLDCWWIGLERLFADNDEVEIAPMDRRWSVATLDAKIAAYREALLWVHGDLAVRPTLLRDTFVRHGVDIARLADEAGLTEEQLRTLGGHRLATIGGHTVRHLSLATLDEDEARREMADNKAALEAVVEKPVTHFAYPFGDAGACGAREARLAKEVGYKTAVTLRPGCLFPDHRDHPHLLPRVSPNGRCEWLSFMHTKMHGLGRLIASRGGDPIVTV